MTRFAIIHHRGDPKQATTAKNVIITRQEFLFADQFGLVRCTPYGDHFIYENPDKSPGSSSFLCTCGSVAVIATPHGEGKAFACLNHATYGFHATSQVDKKDFEQSVPIIKKGKRWV